MARPARVTRMLAGVTAAAIALGITALVSVPFGQAADSRTAVGSAVIDLTPGAVKEWAITTFGTNDKLFLTVMVVVVIAAIAAVTALWERSRIPAASVAIIVAGILGSAAVLSRPGSGLTDVIPTVIGTVCGVIVIRFLTSQRFSEDAGENAIPPEDAPPDPGRRLSMVTLGLLGVGVFSGAAGIVLARRVNSVAQDREAFTLPTVRQSAPSVPPVVQPKDVDLPGFITSNNDFYRIDTALSIPQLSREEWRLRIHGMVDREINYTFSDLEQFEVIEKVVTLSCVSNPVGGDLISNARWTGYRVRDLLEKAGIQSDADMVMSTSIDGFTAGTPVTALTDARDSLLAISMNGEPLPSKHGYPARLVVPGLYGYVSATKWVVDLELTRFDRAQAYWTKLGWAERGPVKTQSRIDVPRSDQRVPAGPVTFGGVAWAMNRGVRAVEVSIDDGDWRPAELGANYNNDAWRLWSYRWDATAPGSHTLSVRATDNTGAVQTSEIASTMPDGATGWHSVSFAVE